MAEADALDPASLRRALAGVDVAYYLNHALGSGPRFEATDRAAAGPLPAVSGPPGSARSSTWVACARRIDFWRVEAIEPGHLFRLRAEMKLPGLAWLELSVHHRGGQTIYRQRALFHPRGLADHLYWHALLSLHAIVFADMGPQHRAGSRAHPGAPLPCS